MDSVVNVEGIQRSAGAAGRVLPFWVVPEPGESFASWLDRGAAVYRLRRVDVWDLFEMRRPGASDPVAFGLDLTDDVRERIIAATRLAPAAVDATLLRSFDGTALDFTGLDLNDDKARKGWLRRGRVSISGSRACPHCLAQSAGVWRTEWKLPWMFACAEHRVLLIDSCDVCGTKLRSSRRDRREAYVCCGPWRIPMSCSTDPELESICARPVAEMAARAAPVNVLNAQAHISRLWEGRRSDAGVDGIETVGELEQLARFLLRFLKRDHLDQLDRACGEALLSLTDAGSGRASAVAAERFRHRGARLSGDIAATAGIATVVVELVTASDPVTAWQKFGDVAGPVPVGDWLRAMKDHQLPEGVLPFLREARARQNVWDMSNRRPGRSAGQMKFLTPLVPALAWHEALEAVQVTDAGWHSDLVVRRAISLELVRTVYPDVPTWDAAADALGMCRSHVGVVLKYRGALRAAGNLGQFAGQVDHFANVILGQSAPVDFGARREALATLTSLTEDQWARVVHMSGGAQPVDRSGLGPTALGTLAAVWVWENVTNGDHHCSPALLAAGSRTRNRPSFLRTYDTRGRKALRSYETGMIRLAEDFLALSGLSGPAVVEPVGLRLVA